jgi:hypothetical protein
MNWRPMTEHVFPWPNRNVIVTAFDKNEPECIEIFRCRVAEHGSFFTEAGGMISLHENGWIPFAWCEDDAPSRDDEKWPPMLTDYLTEVRS